MNRKNLIFIGIAYALTSIMPIYSITEEELDTMTQYLINLIDKVDEERFVADSTDFFTQDPSIDTPEELLNTYKNIAQKLKDHAHELRIDKFHRSKLCLGKTIQSKWALTKAIFQGSLGTLCALGIPLGWSFIYRDLRNRYSHPLNTSIEIGIGLAATAALSALSLYFYRRTKTNYSIVRNYKTILEEECETLERMIAHIEEEQDKLARYTPHIPYIKEIQS